jgi:hypothetical protein
LVRWKTNSERRIIRAQVARETESAISVGEKIAGRIYDL